MTYYYGDSTNYQVRFANSLDKRRGLVASFTKECGAPKEGETWFVLPMEWWNQFLQADELEDKPDNSDLFDADLEGLKEGKQEEVDYVLKPEKVFNAINYWYTCNLPISGEVVATPKGEMKIDLHPAKFRVFLENAPKDGEDDGRTDLEGITPTVFSVSRYAKFGKLKSLVARHVKVKPSLLQIYVKEMASEFEKFIDLAEFPGENAKKIISDVLPRAGLELWDLRVLRSEDDGNRFSEIHKFSAKEPEVGQRVDALMGKEFREGVIVEVLAPGANAAQSKGEKKKKKGKNSEESGSESEILRVKVHFLSFDSSKDKIFPADCDEVKEAYSMIPDWRTQLRVGSKVEICKAYFSSSKDWVEGEITKIDRTGMSDLRAAYYKQQNEEHKESGDKGFIKKLKNLRWPFGSGTKKNKNGASQIEKDDEDGGPSNLSRSSSINSDTLPVSHHGLVMVKLSTGYASYYYSSYTSRSAKQYVFDLGSEGIAPSGTHLAKKSGSRSIFSFNKDTESKPKVHGIVGLKNLTNTCYMNTSLQCLMATEVLSEYFISGQYMNHLNRKNPLGFGGSVATAYGKLVERYFSDSVSVLAPSDFKTAFGNAYTMFQGWGQQDTHEFLGLLLDALHEDLNRVLDKPYIEIPDYNNQPDNEWADFLWDVFCRRNQSVLVDHFYGQLKSHLICPVCANETTKFDEFSNWSVPIPYDDTKHVRVTYVSIEPKFIKIEVDPETEDAIHTILDAPIEVPEGANFTVEKTRYFRFVYEAKNGVLEGKVLAQDLGAALNVDIDNIAIYNVKSNKSSDCLFENVLTPNFYVEAANGSEYVAFEVDAIEDPIEVAADVAAVEKEKDAPVVAEDDKLKGGSETPGSTAEADKPDAKASVKGKTEVKPDDDILYMTVNFKKVGGYSFRGFRLSELLRFPETQTTYGDIYMMIWKRIRYIFNMEEKLGAPVGATPTPEELELSKSLIEVIYMREQFTHESEEAFALSSKAYGREIFDVAITISGVKMLHEQISSDPPLSYTFQVNPLDTANKALNVGFMYLDQSIYMKNPEKEMIDLYKCFDAFGTAEQLGKDDLWYCGKCQDFVPATKQMNMWKTSDILVIALKRFKGERLRREKLTQTVDFPLEGLDLTDYIKGDTEESKVYDLYAVSYHMGTMGGGHYVAKVKVDGNWYDMNDSSVRMTSEDTIVSNYAYVLYYKRRDKNDPREVAPRNAPVVFEEGKVEDKIAEMDSQEKE